MIEIKNTLLEKVVVVKDGNVICDGITKAEAYNSYHVDQDNTKPLSTTRQQYEALEVKLREAVGYLQNIRNEKMNTTEAMQNWKAVDNFLEKFNQPENEDEVTS